MASTTMHTDAPREVFRIPRVSLNTTDDQIHRMINCFNIGNIDNIIVSILKDVNQIEYKEVLVYFTKGNECFLDTQSHCGMPRRKFKQD